MEKISVVATPAPGNPGITLLSVKGYIDTLTSVEFEKSLLSVLEDKKLKLVVDLNEVNYISSAGWGIFIGHIKMIRVQKGDLILAGMKPEVLEVFELLEFNTIIKAFPDVQTAIQKGFGHDPKVALLPQ